jgi:hypothetical protein
VPDTLGKLGYPDGMSLRRILSSAVLGSLAAACGSGSGSSGGDPCPHTVVDKSSTVSLATADACTLAAKITATFTGNQIPVDDCRAACGDSTITDCSLPYDYGGTTADGGPAPCPPADAGSSVDLTCQVTHTEGTQGPNCPIAGRLSVGLEIEAGPRDTAGRWFAASAELEAASVEAFERLARELEAAGAPERFSRRARRAAAEEVRHSSMMRELARRHGERVRGRRPSVLPARKLFEVARENAVEGVVRETFGAALALCQSLTATDGAVRSAHARIAREERGHAELAHELEAWFLPQLSAAEREAIARAKTEAIRELDSSLETPFAPELRAVAGLPEPVTARRILESLRRDLWS